MKKIFKKAIRSFFYSTGKNITVRKEIMDKLITFTLNRTAQNTVLTERQRDKLMIKILLAALQKYMKKDKKKN